ncbi:hypothetical protein KI387_041579, partial [Taxus chinensis]
MTKLQSREIGSIAKKPESIKNSEIMFKNFKLQGEFDIYDPNSPCFVSANYYKPRSRIVKFYFAEDIIFAWEAHNVCAAFSAVTKKRLCFLNRTFDEAITRLYYHNNTASLTIVSEFRGINMISVHIRATPINDIRNCRPETGIQVFATQLFDTDIIRIDYVHAKAVTYRPGSGIVEVFDLNNSTNTNKMLYSFTHNRIEQVICSGGVMMLTFRDGNVIHIQVLSTEDGRLLKSLDYKLRSRNPDVLIQMFFGNVILKQGNGNIQILNLRTEQLYEMKETGSMNPSAVFIWEKMGLILTVRNGTIYVWSLEGEELRKYDDHLPRGNDEIMCTHADRNLIIYVRPRGNGRSSITVRNILTGKRIAEINSNGS